MVDSQTSLEGSWKLVSCWMEFQNSKEKQYLIGTNPNGYLILTPDGWMMTVVTAAQREPGHTEAQQAALYRSMFSYTGRYRVKGDKFITTVEASWNEAWNGTKQERFYKLHGDRLDIVSAWAPYALLPDPPNARAFASWDRAAHTASA